MGKATSKRITKLLVANRGEIACRVFATCRALGIKTVAVYSEADKDAMHVKAADESVLLGAGPANESYLKIDKLLEAANSTGADAIHPGYGFLSERAEFAEAVTKAKIVWVGPQADVINALGNKIAAKKLAEKAKVPTLGWALLKDGWTAADLKTAATKVGFPLLLKAAAGGGGRGMRLVEQADQLVERAEAAAREALGSFGSGELFLEKYCPVARHIEVQVMGDSAGDVHVFGERECSVQRRHQKVIEEAGAPNLSDKTRKALWASAAALAKSVGYQNAGTCEYLVDAEENFYFLEMNTRLQVEHPVSEWIWGTDLVAIQLWVAQGKTLAELAKEKAYAEEPNGHAIEARLYAEDPSKGFMPSPGMLEQLVFPRAPHLRVDTGYRTGVEVPIFYDAMLAKVICWGPNRDVARRHLIDALEKTRVVGVASNRTYLLDILKHQRFIDGKVDTQFLGKDLGTWKGEVYDDADASVAEAGAKTVAAPSPWFVYGSGGGKIGAGASGPRKATKRKATESAAAAAFSAGPLLTEYPGKVLKVNVKAGDVVDAGAVVVVCESMKMEFSYAAPQKAKITSVAAKAGTMLPAGTALLEWEPA